MGIELVWLHTADGCPHKAMRVCRESDTQLRSLAEGDKALESPLNGGG